MGDPKFGREHEYLSSPISQNWWEMDWNRSRFDPTAELTASGVYDPNKRTVTQHADLGYFIGQSPFEMAGQHWQRSNDVQKARIEGKSITAQALQRAQNQGQNRDPQMALAQALMPFGGGLMGGNAFSAMGSYGFTGFGSRMFGTNPMFGGAYRQSQWMQGGGMQGGGMMDGANASPFPNSNW